MNCQPSWRPPAKPALAVGLIGIFLLLHAGPVAAYTAARIALDSNILVCDGRVVFAQGTGSLTVLDLETGQVSLRQKPEKDLWYNGTLERSAHGVLMTDYRTVVFLDGSTFDSVWQADQCHKAVADGEYVVSHNGYHTVSCRNVETGKRCWTIEMEGGWHILAAKGKAVVATTDIWDGRSALLVLEMESGRKLLYHEAPPSVHWLQVYFCVTWANRVMKSPWLESRKLVSCEFGTSTECLFRVAGQHLELVRRHNEYQHPPVIPLHVHLGPRPLLPDGGNGARGAWGNAIRVVEHGDEADAIAGLRVGLENDSTLCPRYPGSVSRRA